MFRKKWVQNENKKWVSISSVQMIKELDKSHYIDFTISVQILAKPEYLIFIQKLTNEVIALQNFSYERES